MDEQRSPEPRPLPETRLGPSQAGGRGGASPWSLDRAEQAFHLFHELVDVLELPVHRGEPHVRDLVQIVEAAHDQLSDLGRGDLPVGLLGQPAFDVVHDLFELRHAHRSFLDGLGEPAHQLVAIEGLAPPVLLHDHEVDLLDPLVGREAPVALQALPAAADDVAVLAFAGVHHFLRHGATVRAAHSSPLNVGVPGRQKARAQACSERPGSKSRTDPSRESCYGQASRDDGRTGAYVRQCCGTSPLETVLLPRPVRTPAAPDTTGRRNTAPAPSRPRGPAAPRPRRPPEPRRSAPPRFASRPPACRGS